MPDPAVNNPRKSGFIDEQANKLMIVLFFLIKDNVLNMLYFNFEV
jgi:hypothetical protein